MGVEMPKGEGETATTITMGPLVASPLCRNGMHLPDALGRCQRKGHVEQEDRLGKHQAVPERPSYRCGMFCAEHPGESCPVVAVDGSTKVFEGHNTVVTETILDHRRKGLHLCFGKDGPHTWRYQR
jgi:hypothetical protein